MMIRALMDGTGLDYDGVRSMTCRQFWRRLSARNRWEAFKGGNKGEGEAETMTTEDMAAARDRFGGSHGRRRD